MYLHELAKNMESEYIVRKQPRNEKFPDSAVLGAVQLIHRKTNRVIMLVDMLGRVHVQMPVAAFERNTDLDLDRMADQFNKIILDMPQQAPIMSRMRFMIGESSEKELILTDIDVSSYINLSKDINETTASFGYVMTSIEVLQAHLDNVWRICYDTEKRELSTALLESYVYTDANIVPFIRWDSCMAVGIAANGRGDMVGIYDEHGRIAVHGSLVRLDDIPCGAVAYSDARLNTLNEEIDQVLETSGLKGIISIEPYIRKPCQHELALLNGRIPPNTDADNWYVNYTGFKLLDDRYMLSACIHAFYIAQNALGLSGVKTFSTGDIIPVTKPKIRVSKKPTRSVNVNQFYVAEPKNYS